MAGKSKNRSGEGGQMRMSAREVRCGRVGGEGLSGNEREGKGPDEEEFNDVENQMS